MFDTENKVYIHELVKQSGQFNFQHCRIPVNNRINVNYMRTMLRDYKDILVCDLLEFGFPIGFSGNEKLLPKHDHIWQYKNHYTSLPLFPSG